MSDLYQPNRQLTTRDKLCSVADGAFAGAIVSGITGFCVTATGAGLWAIGRASDFSTPMVFGGLSTLATVYAVQALSGSNLGGHLNYIPSHRLNMLGNYGGFFVPLIAGAFAIAAVNDSDKSPKTETQIQTSYQDTHQIPNLCHDDAHHKDDMTHNNSRTWELLFCPTAR